MSVSEVETGTDTRADHQAELKEALQHLNTGAKAIRRRGQVGINSDAYNRQHARIDARLTELEAT